MAARNAIMPNRRKTVKRKRLVNPEVEAIFSQTGDRVGNRDTRQARAVTEFASRFISTTCVLNSRKMSTWIL